MDVAANANIYIVNASKREMNHISKSTSNICTEVQIMLSIDPQTYTDQQPYVLQSESELSNSDTTQKQRKHFLREKNVKVLSHFRLRDNYCYSKKSD